MVRYDGIPTCLCRFLLCNKVWKLVATKHILKILTELFFAYSRDKYEVLSTHALADSMTYPPEILTSFLNGQFTVSVKGRPFHNQALDEAQESVINRRLKQITTRPSHFRLVQLADFMAYLEKVVAGLDMLSS